MRQMGSKHPYVVVNCTDVRSTAHIILCGPLFKVGSPRVSARPVVSAWFKTAELVARIDLIQSYDNDIITIITTVFTAGISQAPPILMSDSNSTDSIPTSSTPITVLPALECTIISPVEHRSSTPFSSSPLSERFEYPIPITQPPLPATSPSTHALSDGSIVPPSGTGRGADMTSFASFAPHAPAAALRYPSATASASQAPDQEPLVDAVPADAAGVAGHHRHQHYTAAQLCGLASANSPMPPSLALKQSGLKESGTEPIGRTRNSAGPSSGRSMGTPKV